MKGMEHYVHRFPYESASTWDWYLLRVFCCWSTYTFVAWHFQSSSFFLAFNRFFLFPSLLSPCTRLHAIRNGRAMNARNNQSRFMRCQHLFIISLQCAYNNAHCAAHNDPGNSDVMHSFRWTLNRQRFALIEIRLSNEVVIWNGFGCVSVPKRLKNISQKNV